MPNGILSFRWSLDSSTLAFTAEERPQAESTVIVVGSESHRVALWTIELRGSKAKRISGDNQHIVDFAWSPVGDQFAATVANSEPVDGVVLPTSLVILKASDGSTLRTLSEDATGGCSLSWSPDGKTISAPIYAPRKLSRRLALFSPDGGEPRFPFAGFHATPIGRVEWSDDSRHLFVRFLDKTRNQLVRLDTKTAERKRVSGELINFWSFGIDRAGTTIAFNAESQHDPPDIFVQRDAKLHQITDFNSDFEKKFHLGNVSTVQWKSSLDGRSVYGILIMPPGHQPGTPSPTIVNLHSGPHWWWWEGWMGTYVSWGQFLASHGYAVFLPNHRGSLGQGWEFAEAHFQEWGRGDFQDVIDGVDMLVENGIADPTRLGIGGSSFGGYLTAFTITQTDRFKVAVVEAGWTDLVSTNLTTDAPEPLRRYMGGNVFERRDLFCSRSPLTFVRQCQTPTLILHGQHDRRVSIDQSWSFYRALKLHGVETQMVIYKDEGHGFAKRDDQLDGMRRMKAWFDRYLLSE
jgi:dipeptidyl aminopeptidase/acylaminoacyl peptidase